MPPKYSDGCFREKINGSIEYRFIHEKKQISVYGHSKFECYNKRTDIISGKRQVGKKAKFSTYGKWLMEWHRLYNAPKLSEHTLKVSEININKHIMPILGALPLQHLSGLDIQEFLSRFMDKSNTMNKIAGIIRRSLEKAFALQLIKFNPFIAVEVKKHVCKRMRALSFEEQTFIYNNIDAKYKGVFFFSCCTGLRISEALDLKTCEIDFERKKIFARRLKKSGRNNVVPVPFTDVLFKEVEFNREKEYIFDFTYNALKLYLKRFYKAHNIKGVMTHTFRHTFASNAYYAGIKDKNIQAILGHSTVGMTLDVYTQLMGAGDSPLLEYIKGLKDKYSL